ncbi:MAG: radical SAM protein [Tissierellia bacterium]|nr:radical SAM protein [Tissierellia bacterium]
MKYEGKVFRPPSEAYSLIIQVTVGCSHNQCTFCAMYKEDVFHVVPEEDIFAQLEEEARTWPHHKRFFLADGDALCLSTTRLLRIMDKIKELWPNMERISSYATAKDILRKSKEELITLKEHGLELLYIGLESGSDEILKMVNKDHTRKDYILALEKAKEVGIPTSVTFINGLGGKERAKEHAKACASLVSETNPEYVSFLTLYVEGDCPLLHQVERGEFSLPTVRESLEELLIFFQEYTGVGPSLFRCNHASNYLPLGGELPGDKDRILSVLHQVLNQ